MDLLASYSSDESDCETQNKAEYEKHVSKNGDQNISSQTQQDYFNLNIHSDEDSDGAGYNTYELFLEAAVLDEKCSGPTLPDCFEVAESSSNKRVSVNNSSVSNYFTVDANRNKKQKVQNNSISTQENIGSVSKRHIKQVSDKETNGSLVSENLPIQTDPKIAYFASRSTSSRFPKQCIKTLNDHSSSVSSVCWCVPQYSHLLLTASMDCTLKVWDMVHHKLVKNIDIPRNALKSAKWTPCGTKIICGGYGKKVHIFDINSGKELLNYDTQSYVTSIQTLPKSPNTFLVGVRNEVLVFDARKESSIPVKCLDSKCGQILDMIFVNEDRELVCSTEIVSHDSADRTIMAWDISSGAMLSNQIFQERYTCPCLQVEPDGKNFVAQTNGNYIATFSTRRPYKMNKNKRYDGHKVSGYAIGCDFSPDGNFLASGDAEGSLYIYWSGSAHLAKRILLKSGTPIVQVKWHPVLCSTMAVAMWDGEIQLWQ